MSPNTRSPLQEEMMSIHTRLHHLPFPKFLALTKKGEIPKRLVTLKGREPICIVCFFGTAHTCPWRTKVKKKSSICRVTDDEPGKRISMDQIVSAQPGLIPQMSGFLMDLKNYKSNCIRGSFF